MCFVAMKSELWRKLTLNPQNSWEFIKTFDHIFNFSAKISENSSSWFIDQILLTRYYLQN